jgi:type I restriction enzyme S subunit
VKPDLLTLFDRLSDTPAATDRLRKWIPELAVRGLLAPQNAEDESAEALVARLRGHASSVKASSGPTVVPRIAGEILASEVPSSWAWIALKDIGTFSGGMTPSKSRADFWDGSVNWYSAKDVKTDELRKSELKITPTAVEQTRLRMHAPGSLVIVVRSGILKRTLPVAVLRSEGTVNQDLKVLTPYMEGLERYLQLMLRGFTPHILASLVKGGTTVQSVKFSEFESQPFPLPPLAEQQRILEQVDQLMALCDELEVAQSERDNRSSRLVTASLGRLVRASDEGNEAVRGSASFYLGHLDRLTSRTKHVAELRGAVLDLAVRGRLTAQDSRDEQASDLAARLHAQRSERLGLTGKKATHRSNPIGPDDAPFAVPKGWMWVRADEIALKISDGVHRTPSYVPSGVPFITVKNLTEGTGISFRETKFITEADHAEFCRRTHPEPGDVLVTKDGTIGVARVIDTERAFSVFVSVALVKMIDRALGPFFALAMNSPVIRSTIIPKGAALKHLHLVDLRKLLIPLPPLDEQQRIVTTVEKLLAATDELDEKLDRAQSGRLALVRALMTATTPTGGALPDPQTSSHHIVQSTMSNS